MIPILKNRLLRMFVMLIALFSNNLYSVEENAGKYEGFVFTPAYPSETVDFEVKDILERDKMLLDFHEIDNLASVDFLENSFWAIYSVKLRESKTDEYAAFKDQVTYIENRKLQFNEKESWTRLVKIKGQNVLLDVDLTKNKDNLSTAWSSGIFYGSGYGCVAERPIFSAPLSAGEEDFIFVVTAMKDQVGMNFTGDSFVRLQIYNGKSGKVVIEEYPYLWSAIPTKQDGKLIAYRMRHVALWERVYGVDWRGEYDKNKYDSMSSYEIEEEMNAWKEKSWDLVGGRYQYSKLFISDIDDDDLLEVVFWHKQFIAYQDSAPLKFRLYKEFITVYEEGQNSSNFNMVRLAEKESLAFINEYKLNWDRGWPNEQGCHTGG